MNEASWESMVKPEFGLRLQLCRSGALRRLLCLATHSWSTQHQHPACSGFLVRNGPSDVAKPTPAELTIQITVNLLLMKSKLKKIEQQRTNTVSYISFWFLHVTTIFGCPQSSHLFNKALFLLRSSLYIPVAASEKYKQFQSVSMQSYNPSWKCAWTHLETPQFLHFERTIFQRTREQLLNAGASILYFKNPKWCPIANSFSFQSYNISKPPGLVISSAVHKSE